MGFELPVFTALADNMRWHEARQKLLAENVANAETPNYRGRDLTPYSFEDHMRTLSTASVGTVTTNPMHIAASTGDGDGGFDPHRANSFEVTPEGNAVSLEDEMMKVTTNEMDYQTATGLYTRSMKILRTALGR